MVPLSICSCDCFAAIYLTIRMPRRRIRRFRFGLTSILKYLFFFLGFLVFILSLLLIQRALYADDHEEGTDGSSIRFENSSDDELESSSPDSSPANIRLVLLDVNTLNRSTTRNATNIISFGIFEKDKMKFQRWHSRQSRPRWRLVKARGQDYRRMRPNKEDSVYVNVITHYFLVSSSSIFHIAVIFRRKNFFWIARIKGAVLPPAYRFLADQTFGIPLPMAVERFECVELDAPVTLDRVFKMCVPKDLDFYLWQIPYARFHECHYSDIVYPFKQKYGRKMAQLNDTKHQRKALQEIMRMSKELRIPTMICCGTLLGWLRQCDYIVESRDIDVSLLATEYKEELFHRLFRSEILRPYCRFGTPASGLEYRTYTSDQVALDVFVLYQTKANKLSNYLYYGGSSEVYEFTYPLRQGVCSAELFGVLIFVPCNYADFVIADYGYEGWFAPTVESGYTNINMHYLKTFTGAEAIYMEHIYEHFNCSRPSELWGCDPVPSEAILYSSQESEKSTGDGA